MVSRGVHHLNNKWKYMGVLDIKKGEDLKEVEAGLRKLNTEIMAMNVMVLVVVDMVIEDELVTCLRYCSTSDTSGG